MKRLLYILFASSLLLLSCGDDDVQPQVKDVTAPFLPAASDTSEEAALRRTFFSEHGSYLLFNDTLQHYLLGTDVNGDAHYFTEKIDVDYEIGMSTTSNNTYTYTLLSDIDSKREAVRYLEDYLLSHLTGALQPYSWLLVYDIEKDHIGTITRPYAVTGQRTIIVSTYLLPKLSDAQKIQFTRQVMNVIIAKLAMDNADAFTRFYAVSQGYYDDTFTAPSTTAENTAILAEAGFICRGQNDLGGDTNGLYPSQELDVQAYARAVAANTAEALATKYADYPLVLQKCEIMREILTSLGYKE